MIIDWNAFTPWSALAGGGLIGLASALYLLFNGRVAGISGILGGLLGPRPPDLAWRLAFLLGLVATPALFWLIGQGRHVPIDASYSTILLGGLLVGFGTRLGSGCTSGHGVCGLSRLSPRSMVATVIFMAAGVATVFVARHLLGIPG